MDKIPYISWGASSQLLVLNDFLSISNYELVATFDKNPDVVRYFNNIPFFSNCNEFINFLGKEQYNFVVAIGGAGGRDRVEIHHKLVQHGHTPLTSIHPYSFTSPNICIGVGSQILINATICTSVIMGIQTIINSSASVDHECILGNGVHVGPGAILAGCVNVGDYSFIGTGAVVLPRVKIGTNVIIGAGSVVTKDIPDNVIAYGTPCKIVNQKS